eukprot:scaffold195774_cov50-Prasinocladus_malaysianus.AAC.1
MGSTPSQFLFFSSLLFYGTRQVVELKGNIRVLCRVRPFNAKEDGEGAHPAIDVVEDDTVRIMTEKGSEKEFEFNRCFQEDASQEMVYSEVSSLVTSAVDGYNVCIMAYGQTGSGKTHTMEVRASFETPNLSACVGHVLNVTFSNA